MIVVCIIFILLLIYVYYIRNRQKDKLFYDVEEIDTNLNNIKKYKREIKNEVLKILNEDQWHDWPEKDLYEKNNTKETTWKIFPFYAFGIWENENCAKCPTILSFLKSLSGLKLATLSKLSPGMKLKKHKGWGNHSNHVIRCHFGIIIPEDCYVFVSDETREEIKYHKTNEWLIFDDSKDHYASNDSNEDRIVLIVDIERPSNISTGKSIVGDTKELEEIINYFKKKNER